MSRWYPTVGEVNEDNFQEHVDRIKSMSQEDLCRLHRFAPSMHPYMNGDLYTVFSQTLKIKGGLTPKISKLIGW